MSVQVSCVGLFLEPLDTLFFRDGRPMFIGGRGYTMLPTPQTLSGAVRHALLHQVGYDFAWARERHQRFIQQAVPPEDIRTNRQAWEDTLKRLWEEALKAGGAPDWIFSVSVRGPWFARVHERIKGNAPQTAADVDVLVPVPALLYGEKKKSLQQGEKLRLARPLPREVSVPGWRPHAEGMRPVWVISREDLEPVSGFVTLEGLGKLLRGGIPGRDHLVSANQLYGQDPRVGVAINPDTLTGLESMLYTRNMLSLREKVGFYAEVILPSEGVSHLRRVQGLRWGGSTRAVTVHHLSSPVKWPHEQPRNGQKTFLALTTPGLFEQGWQPACLRGNLAGAVVPGQVAVSGWDLLRRGPKPVRFAASAGSVYFLERVPETLPDLLSDRFKDCRQGWGCYVQGVWNDV